MGNDLEKAPPVQSVGSMAKVVHSRGVDKSQDQCRRQEVKMDHIPGGLRSA